MQFPALLSLVAAWVPKSAVRNTSAKVNFAAGVLRNKISAFTGYCSHFRSNNFNLSKKTADLQVSESYNSQP